MEEDEDYGFEYETDDDEEQDVDIENQVSFFSILYATCVCSYTDSHAV